MRKVLAIFVIVLIVVPLVLSTLATISVSTWVFDRDFYQNLFANQRIYESVLTERLPEHVDSDGTDADSLPADALRLGLREVVSPEYLTSEGNRLVDEWFDFVDGRTYRLDLAFNMKPIKEALSGEGGVRFAKAMAEALPACAVGEVSVEEDTQLLRCLPENMTTVEAAKEIEAVIPDLVADTPDNVPLGDAAINRERQYGYRAVSYGAMGRAGMGLAIVVLLSISGLFWLGASVLGGEDLRGRLQWLGWSLLVPGLSTIFFGLVSSPNFAAAWLSLGLAQARADGEAITLATQQLIVDTTRLALGPISSGFMVVGGVAAAIALGLLLWGWLTPSRLRPAAAVQPAVEPPAQPPAES